MKNLLLGGLALTAVSVFGEDVVWETLALTEDTPVAVQSGDTLTVSNLTGGAFTLTKTGGGLLRILVIDNADAKVVVEEGTFSVRRSTFEPPSVMDEAWFHVDASAAETLTTVIEEGDLKSTRINDVRASSTRYASTSQATSVYSRTLNKNVSRACTSPYVRKAAQNGRDILDFGRYQGSYTAHLDPQPYGAAFTWSERCTTIREVVSVFADSDEPILTNTDSPMFVLGDSASSTYHFHRGHSNAAQGVRGYIFGNDTPDWMRTQSKVWLDGKSVSSPTSTDFPVGFHLLTVETPQNATAGAFAQERYFRYGGQRLGECAVFTRTLTDDEREAVTAYLMQKWICRPTVASLVIKAGTTVETDAHGFHAASLAVDGDAILSGEGSLTADAVVAPCARLSVESGAYAIPTAGGVKIPNLTFLDGAALDVGAATRLPDLSVAGALTKTGDGCLTVNALGVGVTSLHVAAGALRVVPLDAEAYFHVDASCANTLTVEDGENDVQYVTKWTDADGGSVVATVTGRHDTWNRTNPETGAAEQQVHEANKPYYRPNALNGKAVVDFGDLQSSTKGTFYGYGAAMDWSGGSRTVKEAISVAADVESVLTLPKCNAQFFFTDGGNNYHYHRGQSIVAATGTAGIFDTSNARATAFDEGILLDGVSVTAKTGYPQGFHVLAVRGSTGGSVSAFARDRCSRYGGLMIAEQMVFTRKLEDALRTKIIAALRHKWLAADVPEMVYDLADADLAAGTSATFPDARILAQSLTLGDGASLEAESVEASGLSIADGPAVVKGTLLLSDGAQVECRALPDEASLEVGKLVFDGAAHMLVSLPADVKRGTFLLARTTAVEGDLSAVQVTLKNRRGGARLFADAEGLKAEVIPPGMVIIYR